MTQEQQEFINKVKDGAIHAMQKYGVIASMTIAQAILESGWGESGLTKAANNLFGIKADSRWVGEKQLWNTAEYNADGSKYYIDAYFRKYENWEESILDHGKFFVDNPRYHNLLGLTDYKEVCRLVRADGYATDPEYGNMLIGIIERDNLNQYDVIENKGYVKEVTGMINYMAYLEGEGWQEMKKDGEVAGTVGQGKRIEALLAIYTGTEELDISAHIQNIGAQDVRHSGEIIGTIGLGLRIEGIRAYIPGKNIACQVHVEGIGWMDPAYNGDLAGTEGRGLRIEAVKFVVED
jgi:hypothetical protein